MDNAFKRNKPLFIPFAMAGYPSMEISTKAIIALCKAGAGIVEVGVPFSDPIADGPVNRNAAAIALENGVSLAGVLSQIRKIRDIGIGTPLVLFSYLNPILAFGVEEFRKAAKEAGVSGILVVDLPPEEGEFFYKQIKGEGLEIVLLISPTTDRRRFPLYKRLDPGFIYYISRAATTGACEDLPVDLADNLRRLRENFTETSLAVGFGISTEEQAEKVAQLADGVVVGSKLVEILGQRGITGLGETALRFAERIRAVK